MTRLPAETELQHTTHSYNSKWLHDAFHDSIIDVAEQRGPPAPLLITIWLGYEDSHLPPLAVHVPLEEFEQHLRRYVRAILGHPGMTDTRIVLITPPPTNVKPPPDLPSRFQDQPRSSATWSSRPGPTARGLRGGSMRKRSSRSARISKTKRCESP
ncbi:hypothetical protein VTN02DRAFT_3631 [Thermoascus thermophilus]